MDDPEVHANIGIEMDSIEEAELDSKRSKRNGNSLCVTFKEDTKLVPGADSDSSPVETKSLKDELEDSTDTTLYRQHAFKLHGKLRDLPGAIYHTLRFTDDWREVIRWVDSKERRQHVDDYRCKSYISFTESVGNLTALHLACLYDRPKAVQFLLEAGADVSLKDDLGRSALHCLCASESEKSIFEAFKMIKARILEKPPATIHELVNGREKKTGRTPIMEASLQGRGSAIFSLCKSGLNADVKMRDFEDMTPLHYLCTSQVDNIDPRALSVMIQMSDVHARDRQGRTPFLVACENNKPDVAKRLLDAGTDLYVQDNDERSALHYLSASENANITELLGIISKRVAEKARFSRELGGFESPDSVELLSFTDGPVATAREFINKTDSHGMTPLQIALKKEHIENAKILIANGANIDMRLEDERLPLQFACDATRPYVDLAIVLVNYGADTTIRLDEGGINSYSCSLLHFACREDFVELVDCLLQNGADVMDRDTENKRPFYYVQSYSVHKLLVKAGGIDTGDRHPKLLDESCRKGFSEKAIYLIEHVKDVKPKHLKDAIKYNYQSISMAIVKHRNWYKFLRHTYYGDHGETTPFRELIKEMPDVAEVVLNKCMVSDPKFKDPGDSNYSVIMNYEFLEDFSPSQQSGREESDEVIRPYSTLKETSEFVIGHDCSYKALSDVKQECFSTTWGPTVFSKNTHPLSIMVHYGRMNLLSHPLVSSLLHHKWSKFGRYGYYGGVVMYCIFLCFLTAYALCLPSPLTEECKNIISNNMTRCNETKLTNRSPATRAFLYIAAVIIIIVCIVRLFFKTFQLITDCNYSTMFFWLIKLPLYLFSIIFASSFNTNCGCMPNWQWQLGILATFLSWINLVFVISKFPLIGIYVIMLTRVFYTFLKVVLLTFLLVIAFGIAFYMAFNDPDIPRSPFSIVGRSVAKTITMTTGEFDYDDIFRQSPRQDEIDKDEDEIAFKHVSYIIWIIFVIVMPVLLTNMLVGLAVGDIDKIQKGAALKKLALQVNLVLAVEFTLRRRPFKKILTVAWRKIWPNRRLISKSASSKFDVLNWRKCRRYAEELWDQLQFAEWGGGRYDVSGKSDTSHGPCSCGRTRTLDDEIDKIHLQLQAQSKALDHVVQRSQEDLKQSLNLLAVLVKRDHEGEPEVTELLESLRRQGAEELRGRRQK